MKKCAKKTISRPAGSIAGVFPSIALLLALAVPHTALADLLYSASLKSGDYGSGFIVDTFTSCSDPDGSSCGDGDLSNIGISDTAGGVNYTSNNAVINYSLGLNYAAAARTTFRSTGTVSVMFNANRQGHASGQPFVDNYGFNQFNSGQATFGTGMSRFDNGTPGLLDDDQVSIGWSTWHSGVWYSHAAAPVLTSYDAWHHLGFAWGGPTNDFEIWIDGALMAADNLPPAVVQSWGSSGLGLGSAYNFALGMIHQRSMQVGTTYGVTFADLNIWNEYRALGDTTAPTGPGGPSIPEPASLALFGLGLTALALLVGWQRRRG